MPAKIESSIAESPAWVPGILMKTLSRSALACSSAACSIVAAASSAKSGETSKRDESVDPVGALMHGGEEVGGGAQVGDREAEEEILGRARPRGIAGNLLIVGVPRGDRLIEDRRVGGEARNR